MYDADSARQHRHVVAALVQALSPPSGGALPPQPLLLSGANQDKLRAYRALMDAAIDRRNAEVTEFMFLLHNMRGGTSLCEFSILKKTDTAGRVAPGGAIVCWGAVREREGVWS